MCRSQANYCGNFNCSLKYSVRSILDPGYRYHVCAVTTDCDCESRVDLLRILIGVFRREGNVGAAHHGADGTWYVCGQCGRFVPR